MITNPSPGSGSALKWCKSSHSTNDGPACVEVAYADGTVRIRDSKRVQGPQLAVDPQGWAAFVAFAASV